MLNDETKNPTTSANNNGEPMTTTYRSGYGSDDGVTVRKPAECSGFAAEHFERLFREAPSVGLPADTWWSVTNDARTTTYARHFATVHAADSPAADFVRHRRPVGPFTLSPATGLKHAAGGMFDEPYAPPKSEH